MKKWHYRAIREKISVEKDTHFPTIDPKDRYRLTKEEEYVMEHLITSFKYCAHLQEHVRFLFF